MGPPAASTPAAASTAPRRANLATRHATLLQYLRDKVNQLLRVVGTWPLQPEQLDDEGLIALDPIGIIAESFSQILEQLRQTNQDLQLAHDEIRAIIEAAGTGIIVVDRHAGVLGYNRRSQDYFLTTEQDILGHPLAQAAEAPLIPVEADFFGAILRTRAPVEDRDFPFGDRLFHLIGTPIVGPGGELSKVVLSYTDITARVQVEQSLQEAKARLKTILDSVPVGIMVLDAASHRVVDVNGSALRLLGHERDAVVGSICHRFLCPAQVGLCPITDCGQTCDSSERILIHADGHHLPVVKTVARVYLDGREHLLESFLDISQRKEAERALQESEERYRSLYTTMKEGVALNEVVLDAAGTPVDYLILDVNPAYERILRVARAQVVGTLGSQVYGIGDPSYLDRFARVVSTGEPVTFETSFRDRYFYISVVRPAAGKFATIFDDITDRKRAEQQVQQLAYADLLTGLPNRALLLDRLQEALARCDREQTQLALLFLDLDRFKPINDTMGHSVGDALLKAVAGRLSNCVRRTDTVARLGGDEFVILMTGIHRHLDATRAAKAILECFAEPFSCDGHEIFTSLSLGIALYPADGQDPGTLLKSADMAMYVAKDRGRNTYQFYSREMNEAAHERLDLENSLRRALKQQEFFLAYQPQVSLAQGRVTGIEALVRWSNPELGVVPPGRFIPACEEIGLILPLGEWVLRTACTQARAWSDAGFGPLRMAVNLSVMQFRQSDLACTVRGIIQETGIDPAYLELELTESMIMEDAEGTIRTLRELKEMGLRLAIDDFGTGYSSLSYLSSFPIDRIKIAQRFVRDVPTDARNGAIVETIIAIARSLGIEVIAEGVETPRQVEFLRSRGCDDVQGYYFSRPIRDEILTGHLHDWAQAPAVCPIGIR